MTDERRYTILLDPDDEEGGYTVTVPALPGVVTQGETVDECRERAREAIALHIEGLVARGLPVPEERIQPQLATINQRRRLSIDATGTQAAVAAQKRAIGEAACDF